MDVPLTSQAVHMSDEIKYPIEFGREDVVAWGTTGLVVVDKASMTVIKTPVHEDCSDLILREQKIYERFDQMGGHQGILRYHGTVGSGIRLEYAPNGNLRSFNNRNKVDDQLRLQWAVEIAQALSFVHLAGVFHGDLTCHNVFLDEKLSARLADFAGSSLDGSPLLIAETASHEYPGSVLSVQGDLFAFGSVLYEIMTGTAPYADLAEDEILRRHSKGEFPDTNFLQAIGEIIRKCWKGQYSGLKWVISDLGGISQFPNSTSEESRNVPLYIIPKDRAGLQQTERNINSNTKTPLAKIPPPPPFTPDPASLPSTFQSTWRSNPDPTALPFPRSNPPFALTPIDWHQLTLRDADFTPHSWSNLQDLISTHQLEELKRWPSQLKAYLAWTTHVKGKYGSVMKYLLEQRLFWAPIQTREGEEGQGDGALRFAVESEIPFSNDADFKILRNDWGYAFEPGVVHIVVWVKQRLPVDEAGALSEEGRAMVVDFVTREFRGRVGEEGVGEKLLWFKNTTTLQSVRSLEHVHVLVRGVGEEMLERWME